jgi:aryl-alcohol dehydrogenase-like predicted oxidoreductase
MAGGARLWDALQELKRQGLASKIGVSVYTPGQLSGILDLFPIDVVQLPFNIYDQRFLRTGLLDRLKASGVEIHARSAFLQGLLLIPPDRLPGQFEAIREHHGRFYEALDDARLSPLDGSLGFCLAQPQIDHVIVGCESASQLEEILAVTRRGGHGVRHPESFALDDEAIINPSRWRR